MVKNTLHFKCCIAKPNLLPYLLIVCGYEMSANRRQCAHWTFRPYPPIVKNEKYPPFMAHKSKLPPYILTISDNILIAIRV